MEYEFVRFKNLATDEESHKWWFAAKTARQVIEHAKKFFIPTMQEGYNSVRQFGYTSKNPYFEIVETYYSDKLEYSDFKKPTLDDVRFIQWNGGEHWYAKVNKEDITDEIGRQKWNTKGEAKKAAKWYIAKYY